MVLKDVAVGLDGSQTSANALRWATGLAKATSGSVRALGVWRMPLIASMPSIIGGLPSQAFMANQCAEHLTASLAEAGLDIAIEQIIREGDPGPVLAAETAVADLVVVGRTGSSRRRGIARVAEILLGSAARHCIHNAKGPVAVVPHGSAWVDNPTAVVGVDGSPSSLAALAWAVEQLPDSATIYVIRAIPPYLEALLALDIGAIDQIVSTAEQELANAITAVLSARGPDAADRVHPKVVVENARYGLTAPGFDVDVVVVGERGRGAAAAHVLGSTTDYAIRHATCPVIVVPTPEGSH